MRRLVLVVIAVVLAFAAGALAALLLVDRQGAAEALARAAARGLGVRVAAQGPMQLDLWPRPQLSLARVSLQGPGLSGRADRVDLVLDAAALLRLEVRPARVRLVRPELDVDLSTASAPPPAFALELLDGRVALRLPRGAVRMEGVEGAWEPGREEGFALELRARAFDEAVSLRARGRRHPGRIELEAALDLGRGGRLARVAFTGDVATGRAAGRLSGELRLDVPDPPGLARHGSLLALLPAEGLDALLAAAAKPLALAAELRMEKDALVLPRLQLAAGTLALSGSGRLIPDTPVRLALDLSATALEVGDAGVLERLGRVRGVELELALTAARARLGPMAGERFELALRLAPDGRLRLERLFALAPGGTELRASGTLDPGGPLRLDLSALVQQPGVLLAALEPPWRLPAALTARPAVVEARCTLAPAAAPFSCRSVRLRTGAGSFAGSLAREAAGAPVEVRGTLDRLDLDPWLELAPSERTALARRLAPLAFHLAVERLTLRRLVARRVTLAGDLADRRIRLERAEAAELAGGEAHLSGELAVDGRAWRLAGRVRVPVPVRLWRMLEDADPPAWLGLFDATDLDFALERDGGTDLLRLRAKTELLDLSLRREADPKRRVRTVEVSAPPAEGLLLRLGVPPARPEPWRHPLEARWHEERDAAGLVRLEAAASGPFAPLRLALARRADGTLAGSLVGEAPPSLSAAETLWTAAASLLPLPPDPPTLWPGAWPDVAIDPAWTADDPSFELTLRLGKGLRGHIRRAGGRLVVQDLTLAAPELEIAAAAELRGAGAAVEAQARVTARVERIRALPRLARLFQRVDGRLELEADLRTRGASLSALVTGLAGEARIALARGQLRDLAYDPAGRTFRPSPGEALTLGPIEASCTLEGGIIRCRAPLVALGDAGSFDLAAEIDLAAFAAHLRLVPAGGGPELVLSGPLGSLAPASARRAQSEGPSIFSGRTMASNSSAVR